MPVWMQKTKADARAEASEVPKPKRRRRKPDVDAKEVRAWALSLHVIDDAAYVCTNYGFSVPVWTQEERAGATAEAPEAPKPKRGRRKPAVDAGEVRAWAADHSCYRISKCVARSISLRLSRWMQEETAHGTAEALEAPKPKRGRRRPAADAGQVHACS